MLAFKEFIVIEKLIELYVSTKESQATLHPDIALCIFASCCFCSLSRVLLSVTPWNAAHQASLSTTNSWSLLKLMSIESVMPSNHLILYCPLLLPSFNLAQHQGLFQWVDSLHQGGQSIWASASASVLPMNIQGWFPLGLTGFISMKSKGLSRVFSSTIIWKHQFFGAQPFLWSNSQISTWLLENHSFHYMDFVSKVMSLLFNPLSRLVIAFLPRSKHLLISIFNPI